MEVAMKTKAFTLVELLAVMIILSILGIIVFPLINNTIKKSKENALNVQLNNIIDGAKGWAGENMFSLPEEAGQSITVNLETLQKSGFVDYGIKNPKTNKTFPNTL